MSWKEGPSPASLLWGEKLPKPAQNADYHPKPASACSLQHRHDTSIQKLSDSIRYCAGSLYPAGELSARGHENALTSSSNPSHASHA